MGRKVIRSIDNVKDKMENKIIYKPFLMGFIIGCFLFSILQFGVALGNKYFNNNDLSNRCADYLAGQWIVRGDKNFVCVNVNNMPIEEALELCQHEVAHELYDRLNFNSSKKRYSEEDIKSSEEFAKMCEENWTICKNLYSAEQNVSLLPTKSL
jgi:hypothetical protein